MEMLIVALGNPGREYEKTRHNIGWQLLEMLPFFDNLFWKEKFKGLYSSATFKGHKVHILMPQTFMNLSGESVVPAMKFFKVPIDNVLVVHDELDLPFGTLALKKSGGLAGHNGLKSIAELAGSRDFLRLRMGIGRPSHGNISAWVLSPFSEEEKINLESFLKGGSQALELFLESGFEKALRHFSKKKIVID
jgi:PTH1 family peptidyl-tRNA hydrolase